MDKAILYTKDNPDKIRQFINLRSDRGNLVFFTNTGNTTTQTKVHSWEDERV